MSPPPSRAFLIISLVCFNLFSLTIAAALLVALPAFGAIFDVAGTKLPAVFVMCVQCSDVFREHLYLSDIVLLAVLIGVSIYAALKGSRLVLRLMLVLPSIGLLVLAGAMLLPVWQLASMAGGKK
jgi:type II secretory pathway component PulF